MDPIHTYSFSKSNQEFVASVLLPKLYAMVDLTLDPYQGTGEAAMNQMSSSNAIMRMLA